MVYVNYYVHGRNHCLQTVTFTAFLYSLTKSAADIETRDSSVCSASVILPTDHLAILGSAVRSPRSPHFFRVFESFQPFVVLESYINTSIRNNNSVFRKHTFLLLFCLSAPLSLFYFLYLYIFILLSFCKYFKFIH